MKDKSNKPAKSQGATYKTGDSKAYGECRHGTAAGVGAAIRGAKFSVTG